MLCKKSQMRTIIYVIERIYSSSTANAFTAVNVFFFFGATMVTPMSLSMSKTRLFNGYCLTLSLLSPSLTLRRRMFTEREDFPELEVALCENGDSEPFLVCVYIFAYAYGEEIQS